MYCKYGRLILFARFVIYPARHGRLGIEIVLRLRDAPCKGIILAVIAADGAFLCARGCPMVVIGTRQLKLDIVFSPVRTAVVRNGVNPFGRRDLVEYRRLNRASCIGKAILVEFRQGDFFAQNFEILPFAEVVAVVVVFQTRKHGANLVFARIGRHFIIGQSFAVLDAVLPRHRDGAAVFARRSKVNRF